MTSDSHQRLRSFMLQKETIEHEIEQLMASLQATPVGVRGSLVDEDGFPRTDCDVYQVRQHRHRLACLQSDYQIIMKKIELLLPEVLVVDSAQTRLAENALPPRRAETVNSGSASTPTWSGTSGSRVPRKTTPVRAGSELDPFAKVVQVEAGSPASQAGLQNGDKVLQAGPCVSWETLAATVAQYRGRPLVFSIQRENCPTPDQASPTIIDIVVVPAPWAGTGLLGARFERYLTMSSRPGL
ncbi:hypothetical protein CCYA_CCYA15G3922 [Cyanidiococcus yangmingshanensis]|nr:hypothetical protein CCYA_CCYA15G3922 [Cyanidiococcus yangmingshanensis]